MPGRFDDPQSFLMVNKKKLRTAYLKLIKLNLCTSTALRFVPPVSTEQITMAYTFTLEETYVFTKSYYFKGVYDLYIYIYISIYLYVRVRVCVRVCVCACVCESLSDRRFNDVKLYFTTEKRKYHVTFKPAIY